MLVGHSLGEVTITATAWHHRARVAHLVYVGALVSPPATSASIVMTGVDLPPALAEQMIGNLGADVGHRVLVAGHSVMASKPRELAAMINELSAGDWSSD